MVTLIIVVIIIITQQLCMGVHWTVYTPRPDYHNIKGKPGQVYAATICCNVLHAHCALHTRLEFTVFCHARCAALYAVHFLCAFRTLTPTVEA